MTRQERRAAERKRVKELRKQLKNGTATPDQLEAPPVSTVPSPTTEISEARLTANRANAQLSTGPTTPQGKQASSQNSFKHGLYSKQLIIKGEDPAELDALKADLRAEHQPANTTEDILVNEMAEQYWRIKRARRIEANLFASGDPVITQISAIQRLMSSAERGFYKALKALTELQKQRGFVPQTQNDNVARRLVSAVPPLMAAPAPLKSQPSDGFESQNHKTDASSTTQPAPASTSADLRAKYADLEAEWESIERLFKAA